MRGGKEKRNRHWGRETVVQFSLVNFLLVRNKGREIKKRKDKGRVQRETAQKSSQN